MKMFLYIDCKMFNMKIFSIDNCEQLHISKMCSFYLVTDEKTETELRHNEFFKQTAKLLTLFGIKVRFKYLTTF